MRKVSCSYIARERRAFGPSSAELAPEFRQTGQPVICGGSMETGSYLLVGTDRAVQETFGSTMHGSDEPCRGPRQENRSVASRFSSS